MLSNVRRMLQKAPLLAAVLLMWLFLTILSLVGRGHAYRNYSTEHGRLPGLSLVMQGLHDHVLPWTGMSGGKNEQARADGSTGIDAAGGDGQQDAAGSGGADAEKTQAPGDAALSGAGGAEDGAAGSVADKPVTGAGSEAIADGLQEMLWVVPESSSSRVVPAKDYGVAEERYLSPKDTVYNTDTEGLFAPNGIFYSLREVEDTYFSDALFVGDSRTVGLYEYGDMASATSFLARESMSIYHLFDDDETLDYAPKGKSVTERTMEDLLSKAKFRKIYLSVGVNELGVPDTEDYYREFRKGIKKIHDLQPSAIIYIQGIMHVSKAMSSTDGVYNNTAIVQRNQAIATLANGRNIFYIDMNAELCDENGDLKDELTGDGIHLKASACTIWHEYLRNHAAVVPD